MKNKSTERNPDNVNHPEHYGGQSGVECIDFIGAIISQYPGFIAGDLQNVIKYTWRSHHKNGEEDIRKAAWYLNHAEKQFLRLSTGQKSFLEKVRHSLNDVTHTPEQIRAEKKILSDGIKEVTQNMPKREKELYSLVIDGIRDFYSESSREWAKEALNEWVKKYHAFENQGKEFRTVSQTVIVSKRKSASKGCQR